MCACYLIYYYDIPAQDAIRIMRRQRPGSVERKIQEETVAIFGRLLFEYGKSIMEQIEQKERELKQASTLYYRVTLVGVFGVRNADPRTNEIYA